MTVDETTARRSAESAVDRLFRLSNRELDDRFRQSPPGVVPVGEWRGSVVLFPGTPVARVLAAITYPLFWQGKVFDSASMTLRNRVSPLRITAIKALVSDGRSWVDDQPCVLIDYSTTSLVARPVRDEIRLVGDGVYLGVVWLGRRRVAWFVLRRPTSGR